MSDKEVDLESMPGVGIPSPEPFEWLKPLKTEKVSVSSPREWKLERDGKGLGDLLREWEAKEEAIREDMKKSVLWQKPGGTNLPDPDDSPFASSAFVKFKPKTPTLDPVEGDLLPPIGSTVYIRLASSNHWVSHTVIGYYVWGPLRKEVPDGHYRVFVRVRHEKDGTENARPLDEVFSEPPLPWSDPKEPPPVAPF